MTDQMNVIHLGSSGYSPEKKMISRTLSPIKKCRVGHWHSCPPASKTYKCVMPIFDKNYMFKSFYYFSFFSYASNNPKYIYLYHLNIHVLRKWTHIGLSSTPHI